MNVSAIRESRRVHHCMGAECYDRDVISGMIWVYGTAFLFESFFALKKRKLRF